MAARLLLVRGVAGRLAFLLPVLLTIALLPLGAMAIWLNAQVEAQVRTSAESALLGLTSETVAGERALIQSGLGSANALGPIALSQLDRPDECRDTMLEFVRRSGIFGFAGFLEPDGTMECAAIPDLFSFQQTGFFRDLVARPDPTIVMNPEGLDPEFRALVMIQPVRDAGQLQGYVVVSLPQYALDLVREYGQAHDPTMTVLFNAMGDIINNRPRVDDLDQHLPEGRSLAQLATRTQQVLHGRTADGDAATFTVVPLIAERLFVLGIWSEDDLPTTAALAGLATFALPLLMWLVSVSVAYWAVHRLVIRHIRTLNRQMRRFAIGERGDSPRVIEEAPDELRDLSRTFNKLTRILTRDEAALEASLDEKTVLLKEVHHRVKNNLQLIASIISIQARRVQDPQTRQVLKSLQDRVMALATIHRSIYQSERMTAVRADQLIREIVNHLVAMSVPPGSDIKVNVDLAAVELYPDQVVPLSLLVTETVSNALKYVGRDADGRANIGVRLQPVGEGKVLLEVVNSVGEVVLPDLAADRTTNLGAHLIRAFAGQLEGDLTEGRQPHSDGGTYRLAVRFDAAAFLPQDAAPA